MGHFQPAARLWPTLRRSGRARVTLSHPVRIAFPTSTSTMRTTIVAATTGGKLMVNPRPRKHFSPSGSTCMAKRTGVRAFSVHPGSIATELTRHVSLEDMQAVGFRDEEGNIPPRIASLRSFCYLEPLHGCRNYLSVSGSFRTRSR